jgi:DNA-binding transcriptional ArsR family regulator
MNTPEPTVACEPDVARAARLIADPARALMLKALSDGRSVPASMLAAEAGVSAQTASGHLAKLAAAGLVTAANSGRHRYFRLTGPEIVNALEALAVIAPPLPVHSLRESSRASALRRSRTCYDHLAGRLGVALMRALIDGGDLAGHDGTYRPGSAVLDRPAAYGHDVEYTLTASGHGHLAALGVEADRLPKRRPAIRYCVDWSEKQHHLSGALGAALTTRFFELGWLRRGTSARVVHLTDDGADGLAKEFGVVD